MKMKKMYYIATRCEYYDNSYGTQRNWRLLSEDGSNPATFSYEEAKQKVKSMGNSFLPSGAYTRLFKILGNTSALACKYESRG